MTTSRLTLLLAVLWAGLSSVFLLPRQLGFQPVGITPELPKMVGGWYGNDVEVSEKERVVLGADTGTEFSRKSYHNGVGYEMIVTVVLSGEDMNRAIHRPERCMPAQGYTIIDKRAMPVALPERGLLRVTRLENVRTAVVPTAAAIDGGTTQTLYNLTYYWFVGHTDTTDSHIWRTFLDMKDRLIHGYNQRWAYITVAAPLPAGVEKNPAAEHTVDGWVQDFIKQLVPKIHKDSVQLERAG